MNPILEKVLIAVASTFTLSLLSLAFASVRSALFFKRVEYDFTYIRGSGACEWDVEWEDFRLTIEVESVSNDHLKNVVFKRNKRKEFLVSELEPSDEFIPLFKNEIQVKINSIVRKQQGNAADYLLRFVFRRRRFHI